MITCTRRIALIAAAAIVLAGLAMAQGPTKMGMVNSQEVLEKSAEGKKAIAQLTAADKKYTDDITRLDDQIKQLQNRLTTQRLTLTPEAAAGIKTSQQCVLYAVDDDLVFDVAAWPTLWGPYKSRAEAAKTAVGINRGERFLNLSLRDDQGRQRTLAAWRGKVIVLSMYTEYIADAVGAGADAFVSKGEPPDKLLETLAAVGDDLEREA